MLSLQDLKKERELINAVDWEMTPENAVRVYLEWGNIYADRDRSVVRSQKDHTIYFVINCWNRPYYIYLIKRNSQEALELAQIPLPERFEEPVCQLKGVYAVEGQIKDWLKTELGAD